MRKFTCLLITLCCLKVVVYSQTFPGGSAVSPVDSISSKYKSKTPGQKRFTFQIQGGTQGVGANLRFAFLKSLALRVGGSYAEGKYNGVFGFDGFDSENRFSGSFTNGHALLELAPYHGFRLVGGLGYLSEARATMNVVPKGSFAFGDIQIDEGDLGELLLTATWEQIAPYAGIGLGRGIPKKGFNVNLDLGVYYLSAPNVTMIGTKLLAENSENTALIQANMENYRFMPVVQLNFNFKF